PQAVRNRRPGPPRGTFRAKYARATQPPGARRPRAEAARNQATDRRGDASEALGGRRRQPAASLDCQATPLAQEDHRSGAPLLTGNPACGCCPAGPGDYNGCRAFRFPLMRFVTRMATVRAQAGLSRWELAAETIAVKIRWFGLLVGYVLVN